MYRHELETRIFDKMFYIESETVEGIKKALLVRLSKSKEELDVFGNNAKSYVLSKKNNFIQINNLINFMNDKL